ncbi:hypothetical protein G9A89_020768 [Geosiphon pyriformis]|nr:hypothetical protein G9A89_020768 [Geosiphon pyriformis]
MALVDPNSTIEVLETLTKSITALYASPALDSPYLEYFERKARNSQLPEDAPETVKHVAQACKKLGLRHFARFYHVEPDYYEWELQRRAFRLVAPSIKHLCKCVIFENTRYIQNNTEDPTNSKYYCVIVQYITSINTQKLANFVRSLSQKQFSKKQFNFRLASKKKTMELTGFGSNGVSPIGMTFPIPIIMTNSITTDLQPRIFYLGAGHQDWKIALSIDDFLKKTHCYVTDLS